MKAEVRRAPTPAGGAEGEETVAHGGLDLGHIWTRFKEDTLLRWGILAAVALVILVPTGIALWKHFAEASNEKAWSVYADTIREIGSSMMDESPEAAKQAIPKLEAIRGSVQGSTVEPLLLFQLGNRYFAAGEPEKANDVFTDIKTRFPHHPLVDPNATSTTQPPVLMALNDCAIELKFRREHPEPLKMDADLKASKAPPPAPVDSTKPSEENTSGDSPEKSGEKPAPEKSGEKPSAPQDSETAPTPPKHE